MLIPERLPIEETSRTLHTLTENRIEVGGLIVNRVLPDVAEGAFLRARLEQQSEYLDEITTRFRDQRVVQIEQDAHDITERGQLSVVAMQLNAAGLG